MLHAVLNWLGNYITYFPLIIFIGLLLGGLNLPIPEDILVIMSAVICQRDKASVPAFLIALYMGAVLSDYLVYFWGRLIGKGILSVGMFSKIITKDNTYRLLKALQKYGIFTYIISRFIPFGVRNVVSITSGFVKYPFYKFAVYDLVAAFCNISVLFGLVYFFGATGSRVMHIIGIVLFFAFLAVCIYLIKSGKLLQFADKRYKN